MNKVHFVLSFAHRGEAQSFLKELPFKAVNQNHYFYEDEKALRTLLISGEGIDNTTLSLTRGLSTLQGENIRLINLGICGHIPRSGEEFCVGTRLHIKTCLRLKANKEISFKSFTTERSESSLPLVDIITCEERVLKEEDHHNVTPFASLIDREAWAVGFVAHSFQIPFHAIKIVSDLAQGEICKIVKEETEVWSDGLLREYRKWEETQLGITHSLDSDQSQKSAFPELYLTLSQERSLENFLNALQIKGYSPFKIKELTLYNDICEQKIHPKKKTKIFLERLKDLLNPLEKELREKLEKQTQYLSQAGFQVRFDQGFEKDLLHLNITIEDETGLKRATRALEQYDFKKFQHILLGDSLV